MQYVSHYNSPLGKLTIAADEIGLTGLWFDGQKYFGSTLAIDRKETPIPVLEEAVHWLDLYFAGSNPGSIPPLHMVGTEFQRRVWSVLQTIPYGETITYGDIAGILKQQYGYNAMSAQAVGGAVGHNPIGIIVPCHRVVGAGGKMTGYAGGIERKQWLLQLEQRK